MFCRPEVFLKLRIGPDSALPAALIRAEFEYLNFPRSKEKTTHRVVFSFED